MRHTGVNGLFNISKIIMLCLHYIHSGHSRPTFRIKPYPTQGQVGLLIDRALALRVRGTSVLMSAPSPCVRTNMHSTPNLPPHPFHSHPASSLSAQPAPRRGKLWYCEEQYRATLSIVILGSRAEFIQNEQHHFHCRLAQNRPPPLPSCLPRHQ